MTNGIDTNLVLPPSLLQQVDAHVAKAIFDTAIAGVLHGKTRILVLSSNYHLLAAADRVVVMEEGRVVGAGGYHELSSRFPQYFDDGAGGSAKQQQEEERAEGGGGLALSPVPGRQAITLEELGKSARLDRKESVPIKDGDKGGALMEKEVGALLPAPAQMMTAGVSHHWKHNTRAHPSMHPHQQQDRETGSVSPGVYVEYFSGATRTRRGGALLGLGIVLVFALAQTFRVLLDLWLTKMAESLSGEDPERGHPDYWWLSIYWTFAVLTVGLSIFRSRLVLWSAIRSCSSLHERLLRGVLRAPVNLYHDVTPVGRILGRFSKDIDHVDQGLPDTLLQVGGRRGCNKLPVGMCVCR